MAGTELAIVDADEVVRDIGDIIRDTPNEYWSNPGLQRTHADAIAARDAGVAMRPVHDPDYAEIERLRALSADDSSAYWNGSRAPELQARYAALIQHLAGDAHPATQAPDDPLALFKVRDAILDSVSPDERDDLADGFDSLPMGAQMAFVADLSAGPPNVAPLSAEAVAALWAQGSDTTAAAIEDWGPTAGHHLAVLQHRLERMLGSMSNTDAIHAVAWALSLNPGQALAVARALT